MGCAANFDLDNIINNIRQHNNVVWRCKSVYKGAEGVYNGFRECREATLNLDNNIQYQ